MTSWAASPAPTTITSFPRATSEAAPGRHRRRGLDGRHDSLLRVRMDSGPERDGEVLACELLRARQRARAVAQVREGGLQVQRGRVVDGAADRSFFESGADAVALRRSADEQVVRVSGLVLGQLAGSTKAE